VAIAASDPSIDARVQRIHEWLQRFDEIADGVLTPASGDASFRRYFRVRRRPVSRIVMDAPPHRESCEPYIRVAAALREMGIHVPEVLAADLQQGFLLLTDLGSEPYLAALNQPERADALYADAIAAIVTMQRKGGRYLDSLPRYDEALLALELSLFRDWLCDRHLGIAFDAQADAAWTTCCQKLIDNALQQPTVFVHRDFHSRNLMVVEDNNPGVLDFQDAVAGPYAYDVVSLLKDCYVSWPARRRDAWALSYYRQRGKELGVSEHQFLRHFDLTGAQRQLKAAGIFARLHHRDGKSAYLADIPRTLGYVLEIAPRYDELRFVAELIRDVVLPGLGAPAP